MKDVKQVIIDMMQEGTGKAICDSGDAYGRNWERNQKIKDFDALPVLEHDYKKGQEATSQEICFSVNVYHYLKSIFEIDAICEKFNKLNIGSDWDCELDIYGVCQNAIDFLNEYDCEISKPFNTYNSENHLSQVLQGSTVKIGESEYCILQVHNGCDVRGGYTDARLFKFSDDLINAYGFGYINPTPYVYGVIDGVDVSTGYNGWSLVDDSGNDVEIKENSKVELWCDLDY